MKFAIVGAFIFLISLQALAQVENCGSKMQTNCMVVSGATILKKSDYHLSKQGILIHNEPNNFTAIKGTVWFKAKDFISVKTEYGHIEANGPFFVDRTSEKWVRVAAISAGVVVVLPGWGRVPVPNGFEISYSELQSDGKSKLKEYLVLNEAKVLGFSLNVGMDREATVAMLGETKKYKAERVNSLAEMFKQAGLRKIASDEKAQQRRETAIQNEKRERAWYKAKLKSKVLGTEE